MLQAKKEDQMRAELALAEEQARKEMMAKKLEEQAWKEMVAKKFAEEQARQSVPRSLLRSRSGRTKRRRR